MSVEGKGPLELGNADFWNGDAELHETSTLHGKVYHVVNHRVERDRKHCTYITITIAVVMVFAAIMEGITKSSKVGGHHHQF